MGAIKINLPYQHFGGYMVKGASGQTASGEVLPGYFDIIGPGVPNGAVRRKCSGLNLQVIAEEGLSVQSEGSPLAIPAIGDSVVASFALANGDTVQLVGDYHESTVTTIGPNPTPTNPGGGITAKIGGLANLKIASMTVGGQQVSP